MHNLNMVAFIHFCQRIHHIVLLMFLVLLLSLYLKFLKFISDNSFSIFQLNIRCVAAVTTFSGFGSGYKFRVSGRVGFYPKSKFLAGSGRVIHLSGRVFGFSGFCANNLVCFTNFGKKKNAKALQDDF